MKTLHKYLSLALGLIASGTLWSQSNVLTLIEQERYEEVVRLNGNRTFAKKEIT